MRLVTLAALSAAFLPACRPATTELTDDQKVAVLGPDAAVLSGAGAVVVTDSAGQAVEVELSTPQPVLSRPV